MGSAHWRPNMRQRGSALPAACLLGPELLCPRGRLSRAQSALPVYPFGMEDLAGSERMLDRPLVADIRPALSSGQLRTVALDAPGGGPYPPGAGPDLPTPPGRLAVNDSASQATIST
jgi:hypothetical protein